MTKQNKLSSSIHEFQLSVKYPKLGLLGPSFAKTGDHLKSGDERSRQVKKKGYQTSCLNQISPCRSFTPPPSSGSALHAVPLYCSLPQSLVRTRSCKSPELILCFMNQYSILLTLCYTRIGDEVRNKGSN